MGTTDKPASVSDKTESSSMTDTDSLIRTIDELLQDVANITTELKSLKTGGGDFMSKYVVLKAQRDGMEKRVARFLEQSRR
ncbi:hypothetical protein K4K56_004014 [Colletotrichum sp. SAR 10_98]|nr:hypothetical protein K4K56_004014 [Colletotrichum sp. SAR 10_98]